MLKGSTKIKLIATFAHICSIRDLVSYITKEMSKVFANTMNTSNCFFCQNALTQMSNPTTIEQIKKEDYVKYYTSPDLKCNARVVYYNPAVGNEPKVISLDTSLFSDLDKRSERHIARAS